MGAAVGIQAPFGTKGYGLAIGDYDDDGDFDLYISTCNSQNFIRNNFYKNMLVETGSLSFVDVADTNGTQFMQNSYGTEFHDFDDDGDLDLFMGGADRQLSKIFRNNGDDTFTDVDTLTGHALLSDTGIDLDGNRAVDYDNDGDLDLFFHDHTASGPTGSPRKLYRNDGNWIFTDVTDAMGLNDGGAGAYDSAWGDLDRDGDQDLIAPTDSNSAERVYLNDASTNGNHWLYVELAGPFGNTTGIGASLFATINAGTPDERTLRREANTNAGTFNQSDLPVHFGLGAATLVDELRIEWPDGTIQVHEDVAVDQYAPIAIAAAGDFNASGTVTGADFLLWQRNGLADGASTAQLAKWQGNYGAVPLSEGVAVPEPTGAAIVLGFASAMLVGQRRKVAISCGGRRGNSCSSRSGR